MRPRRSSCDCCLTPPMPGSRCTSTSHPSQQTTVKCLYPHKAWMLHGAKANPRSSWLASIGCPLPPLLGPGMVGAPVPLGPAGPLGVAALAAVVALACEGLGALGPAGDRPHPGALPRRAALGGHLGHCLGAAKRLRELERFHGPVRIARVDAGTRAARVVQAPPRPGAPQGR